MVLLAALVAGVLVAAGCGDKGKNNSPTSATDETPSKIRQIMNKINEGNQAILPRVGSELAEENPPWDAIGVQVKELVQLSDELGKYDPPTGDKESWQQQTKAFTDNTAELERAARARDRDKARAAHKKLEESCASCHKAHRQ
jgi:cytochrome c556